MSRQIGFQVDLDGRFQLAICWRYPSLALMQAEWTYHLEELECKLELQQDMTTDWIMSDIVMSSLTFPSLKHISSHGTLKIRVVFMTNMAARRQQHGDLLDSGKKTSKYT